MLEFERGFESVNKTFRIPVHIVEKLEQLAGEYNTSVNKIVIQCLEYALDNTADISNDENQDKSWPTTALTGGFLLSTILFCSLNGLCKQSKNNGSVTFAAIFSAKAATKAIPLQDIYIVTQKFYFFNIKAIVIQKIICIFTNRLSIDCHYYWRTFLNNLQINICNLSVFILK